MMVRSLGLKTDLMLFKTDAIIKKRSNYIVVITPDNLSFFWGNLLIYPKGPTKNDYEKWTADFINEFEKYQVDHMTFLWDVSEDLGCDDSEFKKNGFQCEETIILVSKELKIKYLNSNIDIKIANSEQEWSDIKDFQILVHSNNKYNKERFKSFINKRFDQYKKMSILGFGNWYYAKIENKIVADLGLFWEDNIARYQSIKTHEKYRKSGIAQTLMKFAAENSRCKYFVVGAEDEGPAIRMYKSIDFEVHEKLKGLCKYDKNKWDP